MWDPGAGAGARHGGKDWGKMRGGGIGVGIGLMLGGEMGGGRWEERDGRGMGGRMRGLGRCGWEGEWGVEDGCGLLCGERRGRGRQDLGRGFVPGFE